MDISNINKRLWFLIPLMVLVGCNKDYKPKPIALNNFSYAFSFPNAEEQDLKNSKIVVLQKGKEIDSGKFKIINPSPPINAMLEFYNDNKYINKEDTIKIKIGNSEHFITEIREESVERKGGISPFSNSSKPFMVNFKIDGKSFTEYDHLELK